MTEYFTRMGDGRRVTTTRKQAMDDIQAGMADAVECSGAPDLTSGDIEHLLDIICAEERVLGVAPGNEVVMTEDGGPFKFILDSGSSCNGVDMGRLEATLIHEKSLGLDTFQLAQADYSIKAVKPLISHEAQAMEEISMLVTVPYFYGAMPNMGLYYAPDGPHLNPADLMREFKIEEAMKHAENAAAQLAVDIEFVSTKMMAAGAEGFNFDTTASAGDADFVGTLNGVERLRAAYPDAYINVGMSSENVLGIHGSIEYKGQIVAGLYPVEQAKIAAQAGANVFGPVVNTNTSYSLAWNLARALTIVKDCVAKSPIPCHVNMGMGVGGIPMLETPPLDAVSRGNKAMVEIAHVDGI